jgi:hypothetical protein
MIIKILIWDIFNASFPDVKGKDFAARTTCPENTAENFLLSALGKRKAGKS